MAGDRIAFSRVENTASSNDSHRDLAREIQTMCLQGTGLFIRQRVAPYDSLLRSRALLRLAAAETRIAELESTLREAEKYAVRDPDKQK